MTAKYQGGLLSLSESLCALDAQVSLQHFLKVLISYIPLGVHRQLGVHITKVKSVNLDKWPEGKVPLFENVTNHLVNSFWEKNLPENYRKPGQNASNHEVTEFMTNKYVHRKWADSNWSNDPATLFE